jgi:hypothetical protein
MRLWADARLESHTSEELPSVRCVFLVHSVDLSTPPPLVADGAAFASGAPLQLHRTNAEGEKGVDLSRARPFNASV